jgi:hypothetical protein
VRETGRSGFKSSLIKELERLFPGCVIFNQDPLRTHQGIPDLLILYRDKWAMLETKAATGSARQPNQEYWVDHYNEMSFAAFVSPENVEDVLDGLQSAFSPRRKARASYSQ